jgi:uncharacterized protein (DUF433 family)
MAAALSGATLHQLAYWRTSRQGKDPVLVPEVSNARPILYSFRDVVALRTFAFLRHSRSLHKIRKAIGTLRSIGELEHVSTYTLVADETGSIVLVQPETGTAVDLVKKPGQQVIAQMSDVLRPFFSRGVHVPDLAAPRPSLIVDPAVKGGHPVVRGTRVPFELVAELVAGGIPPEKVSEYYPSVSEEAARDALDFAAYVDSIRETGGRRVAAG